MSRLSAFRAHWAEYKALVMAQDGLADDLLASGWIARHGSIADFLIRKHGPSVLIP